MASYKVVDCEFEFKCPVQWRSLQKTPFSDIRFCSHCNQNVCKCRTDEQLKWVRDNRLCCAIESEGPNDRDTVVHTLGLPILSSE